MVPVPLKSYRVAASRAAWSTALRTSCWSNSDTMSKVGMPTTVLRESEDYRGAGGQAAPSCRARAQSRISSASAAPTRLVDGGREVAAVGRRLLVRRGALLDQLGQRERADVGVAAPRHRLGEGAVEPGHAARRPGEPPLPRRTRTQERRHEDQRRRRRPHDLEEAGQLRRRPALSARGRVGSTGRSIRICTLARPIQIGADHDAPVGSGGADRDARGGCWRGAPSTAAGSAGRCRPGRSGG